ncbi:hypothetical protein MAGR_51080 [Mycolicibacterium agri]|uniref:Uncharacterized protein n=1 Tax=Mycolicibacterium agri TaxID=36811 RepID=A0A7I9W8P6_MYCAG|nr:hypothetical protein MAGR_51080 [Mycolicibacterium agri]
MFADHPLDHMAQRRALRTVSFASFAAGRRASRVAGVGDGRYSHGVAAKNESAEQYGGTGCKAQC